MMDDAGVPVIDGMRIKDGWRSENVRVRDRSEDAFISPDGTRYMKALEQERADLIVVVENRRFPRPMRVRFRLEQHSQLARKGKREQKLVQRGEQQQRVRRTRIKRKGSFRG